MTDPLILSFDTSGPYCAVALMRGAEVLAERFEPMTRGQAERLMPLVEEVMAEADAGLSDVQAIGVGIGPGNFTGIRIAVSAARGLALALGVPAVGVNGFEALDGGQGPSLAVIPGTRGSIYVQVRGADGSPLSDPVLVHADDPLPDPPEGAPTHVIKASHSMLPERDWGAYGAAIDAPPMVQTIARVAADRFRDRDLPRPAPLYMRAADVAPSKETGPVMLR